MDQTNQNEAPGKLAPRLQKALDAYLRLVTKQPKQERPAWTQATGKPRGRR